MKATEYRHDEGRDDPAEWIATEEGASKARELDTHWEEVMRLAERYGFILQAHGGTATLATHAALLEATDAGRVADRMRMCNIDL